MDSIEREPMEPFDLREDRSNDERLALVRLRLECEGFGKERDELAVAVDEFLANLSANRPNGSSPNVEPRCWCGSRKRKWGEAVGA